MDFGRAGNDKSRAAGKQKGRKAQVNTTNPKRNPEGYLDLTAYEGTKNLIREETELESRVNLLIKTLKNTIRLSGFEPIGRIEIKDVKTGREFK